MSQTEDRGGVRGWDVLGCISWRVRGWGGIDSGERSTVMETTVGTSAA